MCIEAEPSETNMTTRANGAVFSQLAHPYAQVTGRIRCSQST